MGALARRGKVVAKPNRHVTACPLFAFLKRPIDAEDSVLMTDEFWGYSRIGEWIPFETINHAVRYAEGLVYTNSIEGFWEPRLAGRVRPASPLQPRTRGGLHRGVLLEVQ